MEPEETRQHMKDFLRSWNNGIYEPYLEACRECFRTWEAWQEAKRPAISMTQFYSEARGQDYYERGRRDAANSILNTMSRPSPTPKLTEREALIELAAELRTYSYNLAMGDQVVRIDNILARLKDGD